MVRKAVALLVLLPFLLLTLPSCGGGGGGSSASPEALTMAAIVDLDDDFHDGRIDDDVFATRLDGIIAKVLARTNGLAKLNTHIMEKVLGEAVFVRTPVAAKTPQEAIEYVTGTDAWLSFKAFMDVAASAMMPEPVAIAKDFADPDVFLAFAAVTINGEIKKALVDGLIDVLTAQELYDMARVNPWAARKALDEALGIVSTAATEAVADAGCMRGCGTFSGDTTVFSGPFNKVITENAGNCVWESTMSGEIVINVTGDGTISDPFSGSMEVSGTVVIALVESDGYCDAGGVAILNDFDGDIFGSDGKVYGEGIGTITIDLSAPFYAAIEGANINSENVSGPFVISALGDDYQFNVTLTKE